MPVLITFKSGVCNGKIHEVGQTLTVDQTIPAGMCSGAWNAIAPYVTALKYGANFPWEKEKGVARIHCPDPQGIVLEIRRIGE